MPKKEDSSQGLQKKWTARYATAVVYQKGKNGGGGLIPGSKICYLGSGGGMGKGCGFFSGPGSFGAREEVGVYGGLGLL